MRPASRTRDAAETAPTRLRQGIAMVEEGTVPANLSFNAEHTWLRVEPDGRGRVGVTHYAQKQLKDVVFVELPEPGSAVKFMEPFGVIESAKATNDLYSPASGTVMRVNEALRDDPGLVNRDPYGDGWMIVIALSRPDEMERLISPTDYRALVGTKE
jgi:glycine cleavage system H protein